jgi:hypothetical protein
MRTNDLAAARRRLCEGDEECSNARNALPGMRCQNAPPWIFAFIVIQISQRKRAIHNGADEPHHRSGYFKAEEQSVRRSRWEQP